MALYRFKSRETADLVMLERDGKKILEALGKDTTSGILQPSEMAAAAIQLHHAAEAEKQEQAQLREAAALNGEPEPQFDPVSFHHHSVPFLDMMKRCEKANVEIVWGV